MRRQTIGLFALLTTASLTAACTASSDDGDAQEGALSARPELKERFADLRKVNTDKLKEVGARVGVNLGSNALNSALKVRSRYFNLGIDIKPTQVFGTAAEDIPFIPGDSKVKSLTDVRTTLATQVGETELPVELTKLRLAHLAKGEDKYYIETGFGVAGKIGASIGHSTGGFGQAGGVSIGVGFKKGESLETHVIVASPDSKLQTLLEANGEAVMAMRGFVVPENAENITAMKPGEMVGLKGKGTFAANLGLGIPILVAAAGPFAYTIAVSAGLATVEGILDVNLVRLEGDEVVVDVGIAEGKVDSASLGITGGFGINHDCSDGKPCLDGRLQKVVGNALVKQLNGFLRTSIMGSRTESESRIELARMRFHLSQPEVPEALAQALHGDLRHAQALYTRNLDKANPPVRFDFDMMRAATTTTKSFGAEIFGIDFYRRHSTATQGAFAVQTPNGVQSVLWDSFEKGSGRFQMDSDRKLTVVSSAATDAQNPDKVNNQANFIAQTVVGDKRMDDDVLLDSADGLIAMLAGRESLALLDKAGATIQAALDKECPAKPTATEASRSTTWDESCNIGLFGDAENKVAPKPIVNVNGQLLSLVDARTQGLATFAAQQRVAALPEKFKDLVVRAAELHLTLEMVTFRSISGLNNPRVSFALNYRFDDRALAKLAKADPQLLKDNLRTYLATVSAPRPGFKERSQPKEADIAKAADAMAALLLPYKERFEALSANESLDLPSILRDKPYVKLPIGIRFDVSDVADANSEERMAKFMDDEKRIRVESISHQRGLLAKELFEGLIAAVEKNVDFGNLKGRLFREQAAAYPLMGLLPPASMEIGMDVGADTSSDFIHQRKRFELAGFKAMSTSARGSEVQAITGQMFNIDAMMGFTSPQP